MTNFLMVWINAAMVSGTTVRGGVLVSIVTKSVVGPLDSFWPRRGLFV